MSDLQDASNLREMANSRLLRTTEQVSTSVRWLSISSIAVAWLFLKGFSESKSNPLDRLQESYSLAASLFLAALALVLDIAQYATTATSQKKYAKALETVLYDAKFGTLASSRTDPAWKYLARVGFVWSLVTTAVGSSSLTSALSDSSAVVMKARNVLKDAFISTVHSDEAARAREFLAFGWSPSGTVRFANLLFSLKVLSSLGAAIALGIYIVCAVA